MVQTSGKVPVQLIVMGSIVAIALFFASGPINRHMLSQQFPPEQLRKYEKLFSRDEAYGTHDGPMPYLTGKVVMMVPTRWSVYREGNAYTTQLNPHSAAKVEREVDPPRLDDHFFRIDSSLRASNPDEVETVILCTYAKHKVGTYVTENQGAVGGALRKVVLLHFYDRQSGSFLGSRALYGKNPDRESTVLGKFSGELPEVCEFIEGLSVK